MSKPSNDRRPSEDTAVACYGVTRKFGDFTAVSEVSFEVPRQAIFGFLGPNGSGKSTVVRMLCGLLGPTAGSLWLDGLNVGDEPSAIRKRLGYMAQKFSLYSDLTVLENLRFFAKIYGVPRAKANQRIDELVELLGLRPYLSRRSGLLSGGWKQRLALGASLIHEPRVLFLDEPTAGIDPVARRDLWDLLFKLSAMGVTIFVTTHYMDEAERCSLVGYIYLSKLLALGTPNELKRLPEVTREGEQWLELHCQRPAQLLSTMSTVSGVLDATVFGENLHLRVLDDWARDEADDLLSRSQPAGWEFREIRPSLEDVFVTLTRHAAEKSRV
ncbi:MAG: ABC transporter ATP-binding protein [Myxococcales bacterium]|nr:ABC transporter ATP-binding protein [Myxococcales bacterium]